MLERFFIYGVDLNVCVVIVDNDIVGMIVYLNLILWLVEGGVFVCIMVLSVVVVYWRSGVVKVFVEYVEGGVWVLGVVLIEVSSGCWLLCKVVYIFYFVMGYDDLLD